jgi:predicted Rdx family selenoprotein
MQLGVARAPESKALEPEASGGVKPVPQRPEDKARMDGGNGRAEALKLEVRDVVEPMPHRPEGKFLPRPAGAEEEDERYWV